MKNSFGGYQILITVVLLLQISHGTAGLTTFKWNKYNHLADGMMGQALYKTTLTRIKCASECMKNTKCKYMGYNKNTKQCNGYQTFADKSTSNVGLDIWGGACKSGFHMIEGMCINIDLSEKYVSSGEDICNSMKSRLAILNTQKKIDEVSKYISLLHPNIELYWVGVSRALLSRKWTWQTGEAVDTSTIIDNNILNNCLTINVDQKGLNSKSCTFGKSATLCEDVS